MPVQADPAGGGRAAGCGGVQGGGDGLGEFFEAGGEVQVAAEPGAVEMSVDLRDLAAQGGDLDGQGGQALAREPGGKVQPAGWSSSSSAGSRWVVRLVIVRSSSAM